MDQSPKNKLTEEDIAATIVKEEDSKLGAKTTVVMITLVNGFEVVGTSSCVDPENYDHELGVRYARRKAIDKVWELEGYKLQSYSALDTEVVDRSIWEHPLPREPK